MQKSLLIVNTMMSSVGKLLAGLSKKSKIVLLIGILVLLWILKGKYETVNFVEPVFRRTLNRVASSPDEFCFVSYNILSDPKPNYTGRYLSLPRQQLLKQPGGKNSPRHKQFMKEILWLQPDIINLQEVDKFYFPILVEEFGSHGFEGVYDQHRIDTNGLATFYKTKRFKKKRTVTHQFCDLVDEVCNHSKLKISRMSGANRIVKFTLLEENETGRQLVIGVTHILFGEWKYPDNQALQIALFFQQLHKFLSSIDGGPTIPWVLSGDFNMYPYYPAYQLVTNGKMSDEEFKKVDPTKYKYPKIVEKNVVEGSESLVLKYCREKITHPLQDVKSAYKTILGSEPPLTHYQMDKNFPELYGSDILKGTLDYIWYSSNKLQVNAILEHVKEEVIKPLIACPNKYFPSDHLSMKACFKIRT